jgi:hypothetical protein
MTGSLSRHTGYKTTHSNKVMEYRDIKQHMGSTAFVRRDVRFIILYLIYLFDKLFKWWMYIDDHFHVILLQLPR